MAVSNDCADSWIVVGTGVWNMSAGQSQVKIRADPTTLGSIFGSLSQLTCVLGSLRSFHVHVSGDLAPSPWMAMMSIPTPGFSLG